MHWIWVSVCNGNRSESVFKSTWTTTGTVVVMMTVAMTMLTLGFEDGFQLKLRRRVQWLLLTDRPLFPKLDLTAMYCNANLLTVWCMVQCTNHQWLFGTLAGTEHQAPVVQQQVVEGAIEDHPHQRNDLPPPEQPNFTPIFVTPQQLLLTDTLLSNYQTAICYYQCVLVLWHSGTIQLSKWHSGKLDRGWRLAWAA